tara:strand:+ start:237 stop:1259 length:1023 start_codon:yes stop_codon:yes gene_type:complete
MSDVSIIIQGPLNEISLRNIPIYKKYGKVIVSCWDGYDEELLKYIDDDVRFVSKKLPSVDHYNDHNVYYQASTIYSGLEKSETEFSIKFRSDESYSNLDTFVKALIENPECIITGDIYFYPGDNRPLYISDHIIGGKTKNLLGTFDRVKNICETTPLGFKLMSRRRVVALEGDFQWVLQRDGRHQWVLGDKLPKSLHYIDGMLIGEYIRKLVCWPMPVESLIMISFLQEIGAAEPQSSSSFDDDKDSNLFADLNMVPTSLIDSFEYNENYKIIIDDDVASRSNEMIKSHARVVPTMCMGDVFLKALFYFPAKPIKSGSEELLMLKGYDETFTDIEIGCES